MYPYVSPATRNQVFQHLWSSIELLSHWNPLLGMFYKCPVKGDYPIHEILRVRIVKDADLNP